MNIEGVRLPEEEFDKIIFHEAECGLPTQRGYG